jgi:hypothetical protein
MAPAREVDVAGAVEDVAGAVPVREAVELTLEELLPPA